MSIIIRAKQQIMARFFFSTQSRRHSTDRTLFDRYESRKIVIIFNYEFSIFRRSPRGFLASEGESVRSHYVSFPVESCADIQRKVPPGRLHIPGIRRPTSPPLSIPGDA